MKYMHRSNLKHEPREAQLNNAGFSLVELLIAVIILAIIVIPFSRSFVVSARMNGNSRRLQRATTVGQDIVEGLKAYNIDEIRAQFNNPSDGFYITDSRLIHGHIEEDKTREQGDANYSGTPEEPGVYYFAMEDFEIQGVAYDALIKLDASVYEEGHTNVPGAAVHDPNLHDNAFNTNDMARAGSVMKDRDGSFSQPALFTQAVLEEIKDIYSLSEPGAPADPLDVAAPFSFNFFKSLGGKVNRTITLNISKDHEETVDGETVIYCKADITFKYECEYGADVKDVYGRVTSSVGEIKNTDCGNKITSGNFYLFYYPCYEAESDKIVINNTSGVPLQIFIVKQVDDTSSLKLSDAQLNVAETGYKVEVNINDSTNNKDNVIIRTNLGMNLVNSAFLGGTGVRLSGQMPTYEVEKPDLPDQAQYKFNGVTKPLIKPTESDAADSMNIFGLAGTRFGGTGGNINKTEVIFDIEVSIYRQGAYAAGFPPEEQPMVVIEGSKNN